MLSPMRKFFILFSYMASITKNIEFATGIIILPQRQTALVAKQAATLDVLSEGRLRLGIGTGWNNIEYEALNENFSNRGVRSVEQIKLMKEHILSKKLIKVIDSFGCKKSVYLHEPEINIKDFNEDEKDSALAVSYTHLTLPTKA